MIFILYKSQTKDKIGLIPFYEMLIHFPEIVGYDKTAYNSSAFCCAGLLIHQPDTKEDK